MKKALKILAWILALLVLLLIAGLVLVQSPKVQTYLGKKAVQMLQNKTDAQISFGSVAVSVADALVLKDVVVLDPHPQVPGLDTLASAGLLSARFSLWGFLEGKGAYLSRVTAQDILFQYATEPDSLSHNGLRSNLQRVFRLPYSDPDKEEPHWGKLLSARQVTLRNVRFNMESPVLRQRMEEKGYPFQEGVIDWTSLHVQVPYARVHNVKVADDFISGAVDSLSIHELDTGLDIEQASARRVRVGKKSVRISHLHLKEPQSNLYLNRLTLLGPMKEYGQFIDKIRIQADIRKGSLISMETVSHFGPNLDKMSFKGWIQGKVHGYVNDLCLDDVQAQDAQNDVKLRVNGCIMGLPDMDQTHLNINVQQLDFSLGGIMGFAQDWAPQVNDKIAGVDMRERFSFRGGAKGPLNRLHVNGKALSATGTGEVTANVNLRNAADIKRPLIIDGHLGTRDLDLGRIIKMDALGPLSLETGLEATFNPSGPQVRLDSLKISRLNAFNYDYSNISAAGTYTGDAFDGRIIAADPNLNFLFQGLFNLSKKTQNAAYQFYASLGYADLHALHLDKRERSKVSFQASSNFIRTEQRDLLGDITVSDILLESETGRHMLGDIIVRAHANDNVHRIRLESSFLNGSYVGDKSISDFINDLKSLVLDRELAALSEKKARPWERAQYEANLKVRDAQPLLHFLAPGVYVANPSEVSLKIDANGRVKGCVKSGRIAYYDKYIKDLTLNLDNGSNVLGAEVKSSAISVGSGGQIKNNRLSIFADDNHLGMGYTFDNGDEQNTRAEIYLSADLSRDENGLVVNGQALPSNVYFKGDGWGISSEDILYKGGELQVRRLMARHEDEQLLIDGGYSPTRADTLNVTLDKFNIGLLNTLSSFIPKLEGQASGKAVLVSPAAPMPGVLAGIVCDSTRISGHRMGQLRISSKWDEEEERFNLLVRNRLDGANNLDLRGYLKPATKEIHARARFNRLDLGYVSSFFETLFSRMEGSLNGEVIADGRTDHLDQLQLKGQDLQLQDATLALDFTRVPYKVVNGKLDLDSEALHFTDVTLEDGDGGSARVKGKVLLGGFQNLALDTHLDINNILALDLPKGVNPFLYGHVYGTGQVHITGPLNRSLVEIDATTTRTGELHLVTSSGGSTRSQEILSFTQPQEEELDPYDLMMSQGVQQKAKNDATFKLRVRPTTDLMAYLELSENTLNARGSGVIELESHSSQGGFTLGGYYAMQSGSFHFSTMNLVSRDFSIQDGSIVRFNGEVMDTDLDVRGLYTTKASLANLISSEGSSNRRTVNCGINITGKLRNPEVNFTIEVPDLNPSAQAQVENALNTADKVQKQFIYLLLASSFLPSEESGITTGGSEVLFSNVSSIMSGQLNNIFQKLNIPLDLGLNYQTTQSGSNIFDVAMSTQLFNNRVIVNGSVGNKQAYGTSTNEVAGNVDIEVKLDRSGTLRLNIFSHAADQFSSFLDNSQRNGAGITYQREFNSFRQFFRDLFSSRRTREQRAILQEQSSRNVVLQIDSTGKATPKP